MTCQMVAFVSACDENSVSLCDATHHLWHCCTARGSLCLPHTQVTHRLFLKALSSLKGGVKAGTEHHKVSQDSSPMVKALVAMAKFCDAALRSKEEGKCWGGWVGGWGHPYVTTFTFRATSHCRCRCTA